jgi:hypothetical protein
LIARKLRNSDLDLINEFWERDHKGIRGIPDRRLLISECVVENGKIIGYGHVKVFGEALMFLNQHTSQFEKAKAFKLMMDQAIRDSKRLGLDFVHVGVDDSHFEEILRTKYNFTDRGLVLSLELKDG